MPIVVRIDSARISVSWEGLDPVIGEQLVTSISTLASELLCPDIFDRVYATDVDRTDAADVRIVNSGTLSSTGNFGISVGSTNNLAVVSEPDISEVVPTAVERTGSGGDDFIVGTAGADEIRGLQGDDYVVAFTGADTLWGGSGKDRLFGDQGADVLHGDAGADKIHGGGGWDRLYGGIGADTLFGGDGADRLRGGEGRDVFVFWAEAGTAGGAADIVVDFQPGTDHIRLDGLVSGPGGIADLLAASSGDTLAVSTIGGRDVRLLGHDVHDLHASDFIFV